MLCDCHIHMVLDGIHWKTAIARHGQAPEENFIRTCLRHYQSLGFSYLRDGGDRWGVGAAARAMAPEYGITYRTPLSPLCKAGHYGAFIGETYSTMKEYALLVKKTRQNGGDFIKIMISGLMDFNCFGRLTEPGLPAGDIRQLIHIAHEEGFSVMAHANGARTMQAAAEAGVDSIEHGAYADTEAGGPIIDNFIPELTQLAEENINFSHDEDLGGAKSFSGTTWTAAALVSQTAGVCVQVPLTAGRFGGTNEDSTYMPGVVSIGEILEDAGYQQAFLMGSDSDFGGRDTYFTEHGNYEIIDTKALKAQGRLPEDYDVWWGFEDKKLWDYAKEELTRISQGDEPFNFTMLTCDSHFPNGYRCEDCGDEYDKKYPNVLHCCSSKVMEFIEWCKEQPFYENTTIVLCGDHLTMDPKFFNDVNPEYDRTIYNCIINAPVDPVQEKNRVFGTYDMFPTTLAALGVEIEGNRLGLGTNLFSDVPTLAEQYGFEHVDYEFQKNSDFYNSKFLDMYEMPRSDEDEETETGNTTETSN